MKEREEDHKDKQMPTSHKMSPYIYAGLDNDSQSEMVWKADLADDYYATEAKLQRLMDITVAETGYSATQLRHKNKGRIGLSTVRQVFMIIGFDAIGNKKETGKFVNRSHCAVVHSDSVIRDRIGMKGYELLTTTYDNIKDKYE